MFFSDIHLNGSLGKITMTSMAPTEKESNFIFRTPYTCNRKRLSLAIFDS